MANIDLDSEQMEAAERERQVELRVKFSVTGMHGRLNHIHPIIADGKAKKLANANWRLCNQFSLVDYSSATSVNCGTKTRISIFKFQSLPSSGSIVPGINASGSAS